MPVTPFRPSAGDIPLELVLRPTHCRPTPLVSACTDLLAPPSQDVECQCATTPHLHDCRQDHANPSCRASSAGLAHLLDADGLASPHQRGKDVAGRWQRRDRARCQDRQTRAHLAVLRIEMDRRGWAPALLCFGALRSGSFGFQVVSDAASSGRGSVETFSVTGHGSERVNGEDEDPSIAVHVLRIASRAHVMLAPRGSLQWSYRKLDCTGGDEAANDAQLCEWTTEGRHCCARRSNPQQYCVESAVYSCAECEAKARRSARSCRQDGSESTAGPRSSVAEHAD